MGIIKQFKEYLVDRYLTWRTGKSKEVREWEAWYEVTVNYHASTIIDMFKNFKYVVEVDHRKFFTFDPLAWVPTKDAKEYFWPQRKLGENCVWRFERVFWDTYQNCWYINSLGDSDRVFVACNDSKDATMIALKFGGVNY